MTQILESQQIPHKLAREGVSFVKILEKADCVITAPHCIWLIVFLIIATVVPISQIPRCIRQISYNALILTEMCTCVHISLAIWYIVGYEASCGTFTNFHCDSKTISMLLTLFDRSLVESPHRVAVIRTFDISFGVRISIRLNNQWSYRRFETPWRSGDVTVMSMISHSSLIPDGRFHVR